MLLFYSMKTIISFWCTHLLFLIYPLTTFKIQTQLQSQIIIV